MSWLGSIANARGRGSSPLLACRAGLLSRELVSPPRSVSGRIAGLTSLSTLDRVPPHVHLTVASGSITNIEE